MQQDPGDESSLMRIIFPVNHDLPPQKVFPENFSYIWFSSSKPLQHQLPKEGWIHNYISRLNPELLYQRSKTLISIFRPPTHGHLWSSCCLCDQLPRALDLFRTYMLLGQTSGDLANPSAETPGQRICSYHWHRVCHWLSSQNKHSPLNSGKSCWCRRTNKPRGTQTTLTGLCFC